MATDTVSSDAVPFPAKAPKGSTLFPGESVVPGEYLQSLNGQYQVLVLDEPEISRVLVYSLREEKILSTLCESNKRIEKLAMQVDGNLVVYAVDGSVLYSLQDKATINASSYLEITNYGRVIIAPFIAHFP